MVYMMQNLLTQHDRWLLIKNLMIVHYHEKAYSNEQYEYSIKFKML